LANVSVSDVRDTINIGEADVPDGKLQKMIKRAEVTLELELGREIDSEEKAPPLSVLQQELERILSGLKPPVVGSA
jgi:hypothetical protein